MVNFMTQTSHHSAHKSIGILETNGALVNIHSKCKIQVLEGYDTMSVDKQILMFQKSLLPSFSVCEQSAKGGCTRKIVMLYL